MAEAAALMLADREEALTYNGTTAFTGAFIIRNVQEKDDAPTGYDQKILATAIYDEDDLTAAVKGHIVRDSDDSEWEILSLLPVAGTIHAELQDVQKKKIGRL